MTKERLTFTLSKELNEAITLLAAARQMTVSEFLETRLYMIPEIQKQIERFQNLPEDPIIDTKKIEEKTGKKIPARLSPKAPMKNNVELLTE